MEGPEATVPSGPTSVGGGDRRDVTMAACLSEGGFRGRPSFRISDIWKAPLHDLPVRDEVLYQYLPFSLGMEVLEIGPGSGFTAFRLAREVRHVTAVDAAAGNITELRRIMGHLPNVTFIHADVCSANLAAACGKSFHAVFALEVFEFLTDSLGCLRNLASVLHTGGSLLLEFANYLEPKSPGPTHFCRREELDKLLAAAGFQSWEIYALRLRPVARALYHALHEPPMRLFRWVRNRKGDVGRTLVYDDTWAFRRHSNLVRYKYLIHSAWVLLMAAMRGSSGVLFERRLLNDEIFGHDLMIIARR